VQDFWLFVYAVAPDSHWTAIGVFPPELEEEALEFLEVYRARKIARVSYAIRKSTWRFGQIPSYADTLPI
jgi:hypothetical protein